MYSMSTCTNGTMMLYILDIKTKSQGLTLRWDIGRAV